MRLHILHCSEEGKILVRPLPQNEQVHAKKAHCWAIDSTFEVVQLPHVSCMREDTRRYEYCAGLTAAKKLCQKLGVIDMDYLAAAAQIRPMKEFEISRANDYLLAANLIFPPSFELPPEYRWAEFEEPFQYRFPGNDKHHREWLAHISAFLPLFDLENAPVLV
jgi:hypothetical protein